MIKPGGLRSGIEFQKTYTEHLVTGVVPTSGVQYSSVATVGTTAVELLNKLIDPGFSLALKELDLQFHHRFVGLKADSVGSIYAYWEARSESIIPSGGNPVAFTGAWVNVTGTHQITVGTLVSLSGTFAGYANLASLPYAPVRVRLTARSVKAADVTGEVVNSAYVKLVGNIIPGT